MAGGEHGANDWLERVEACHLWAASVLFVLLVLGAYSIGSQRANRSMQQSRSNK